MKLDVKSIFEYIYIFLISEKKYQCKNFSSFWMLYTEGFVFYKTEILSK